MRFRLVLLLVSIAIADEPKPAAISGELRARFWRAQAELVAAQMRVEKATNALQTIQAEMVTICRSPVRFDGTGEPACAPLEKTEKQP